jgi:integrase
MPKLTTRTVAALTTPGIYGDGGNLFLKVDKGGSRSWVLRLTRHGRMTVVGLGPLRDVSLADARNAAAEARKALRDGIDPRAKRAEAMTFGEAAEAYIAAHRGKWKHERQERHWRASLANHAEPLLGMPIAEVDVAAVLKVLTPIWSSKTSAAAVVRRRIEAIWSWARVQGHCSGDNPAGWPHQLAHVLPAPSAVNPVVHHRAVPYADVPQFLRELQEGRKRAAAAALTFLVLTAVRTDEVRLATWAEVDLDAGLWTIPGARMKTGKPHVVPLSDAALAVLSGGVFHTPPENGLLFPGKRGAPLGSTALFKLLRRLRPGATVHGFRSGFADFAAEVVGAADYVIEQSLAHSVGDATRKAYRRSELIEPRRRLMQAWADHCGSREHSDNVVNLR